jgi:hypothetical protein
VAVAAALLSPAANAGAGPIEGYVTGTGDHMVELWLGSKRPAYVSGFREEKLFADGSSQLAIRDGVASAQAEPGPDGTGTIEGTIRDSVGGPVGFAVACAQREDGEILGCALNRPDGSYALTEIPAGEYTVQFGAALNVFNLLNQFYDHRAALDEADFFALAAGETKTGIDADLEAGGEIRGTVYSAETGGPAPGVGVCSLFFERAIGAWFPRVCSETGSDGSYAHFALFNAGYKVAFSPELKEFFGQEVFEGEDDGLETSFFNDQRTLEEAEMIRIVPPEVVTGVDGHLHRSGQAPLLAPGLLPAG